ncbi:efflux RND transporter periplasmic adaptor subunit [Compostibacter hankyongensis]|uniref:Efflux RND transporter periplasmic adaptor subunit n=1 Tax=Compostibacter hankyongensis TaxID=1007089 RepID=A0ABP8FGW4_9BACT
MHKLSTRGLAVLLTAAIPLIQGCGASGTGAPAADTAAVRNQGPEPEVFVLRKGQLSSSLKIPGELIAFQQVDLYAKVSSFVRKLYVDVGSEVHRGQRLAEMEAPELSSQLAGAASRLKSQEAVYLASKATYERLLQTSKTPGTVSQNDLDLADAKQKSDLAQLEAARAAYREISDTRGYLEMNAPFSGVISARNVSPGAYVGPAGKGSEQPVFTLQEQRHLRLVVSVPEAYTDYLKRQREVRFTVGALAGRTFGARITRLAGALDTRLRSQRIEMDVDNADRKLLPGMVAEVTLPVKGDTGTFVIPSSAVLNSTEGVFVIKIAGGKASWVPVETGHRAGDSTEIYGALSEGDVLLTTANEETRNGSEMVGVRTD